MNEGQEGQNIEDLFFMIHFNVFIFPFFFLSFFPQELACSMSDGGKGARGEGEREF